MQAEVIILGSAGFGGGELLRILSQHPAVGSLSAVSRSNAGKALTDVHPQLHNLEGRVFRPEPDWEVLGGEGPLCVFSAMQHRELAMLFGELRPKLAKLAQKRRLVFIDLSSDFRLDSAERYAESNGDEHPCPEYLADFVYGLPELSRELIRGARWIASPGCFATAMCLALLPLSKLDGLGLLAISGSTGSSGSGIRPSAATHHPARANDFRAYSVLAHRHLGEAEMLMAQGGAKDFELSFVAHSAPLVRGIHVTLQCRLPAELDAAALYQQRYAAEPFVRIVERAPRVATVAGSNFAEIGVVQQGHRLAVLCALDNLGKGMAGQAVQNMNLALGLDETAGLQAAAVYP